MTDKPEKPLSERIREAEAFADELHTNWMSSGTPTGEIHSVLWGMQKQNLGFLAELAEMMEKK